MKKAIAIFVMAALLIPSAMAINVSIKDGNIGSTNLNNPPAKPTISGPTSGETGTSYTYTAVTTDPDGDKVFYCFDWGDGDEFCTNLYDSGEQITSSHTWDSDGDYTVTVKATDENGAESEPATLKVSMPLTHSKNINTHTVLAEMGSTTWCPGCPPADEKIEELY
ncbi:MAG TPA: PKD domain-containing protein, partial [Thermoplasmatales archaeon]|nr:PKD domain-containing protein [Thermoplasmatales archaeon]